MYNCENCLHRKVCPGYQVTMPDCKQYKNEARFIELPCKVGDTVYDISGQEIYEMTVVGFEIDECQCVYLSGNTDCGYDGYDFNDFGKTVFLTQEKAAEQALKEREKNA